MAGNLNIKAPSGGTVTLTAADTASNFIVTLPAATGNILSSTAVSASTTNTVTNKIAINVNGTTYYLLASTSST
jgi:hypothetical protein